jgi:hypothetical protein
MLRPEGRVNRPDHVATHEHHVAQVVLKIPKGADRMKTRERIALALRKEFGDEAVKLEVWADVVVTMRALDRLDEAIAELAKLRGT